MPELHGKDVSANMSELRVAVVNPTGSQLLYIPPSIKSKFPDLTSADLQIVLDNMDEWTQYLRLSADFNDFIEAPSQARLKESLKRMKVI